MSTLLATGFDQAMAPIGELTSPIMAEFAARNGFDFKVVRNIQDEQMSGYCFGLLETALEIERYSRVIWMESDILITNLDYRIPELSPGLHVSRDWGDDAVDDDHFSTCAFIAHQDAEPLFRYLIMNEPEWRNQPFPFQEPLRRLRREHGWAKSLIHVHPRKMFNCVPSDILGAIEPWQEGDWLCHLTHIPVEKRVELFHKIANR